MSPDTHPGFRLSMELDEWKCLGCGRTWPIFTPYWISAHRCDWNDIEVPDYVPEDWV